MPQLIKVEEDGEFIGYAIRKFAIPLGYQYLSNFNSEFWYTDWVNKDAFLFTSEEMALARWSYIMKKRKIKRKITVIKNL